MSTEQWIQILILGFFAYISYRGQRTLDNISETVKGFTKLIHLMEKDQKAHAAKSGVEHREILDNSKNTLSIVTKIEARNKQ